jgi:Tfp pilus assembly protein PilV
MRYYKNLNQKGSILLEALLAVVILATALTAVIQAMMSGLRSTVAAADYLRAANILDQLMIEKFVADSGNSKPVEPTQLAAPYERYQYSVNVSDVDDADLKLRSVECSVEWPAGKGKRMLTAALLAPGAVK